MTSMTLPIFNVADRQLDSLDLKVSILGQGIHVHEEIYDVFEKTHRLSRHPYSCNNIFLGDRLPIHLARTGPETCYHLILDKTRGEPRAVLTCSGVPVTEVTFPEKTAFYAQTTSTGIHFGELATLQGLDMLAFAYLWACEIAKSGNACKFCHSGDATLQNIRMRSFDYTLADIAEIAEYAVNNAPHTTILQLTAGSTMNPDQEIPRYVDILKNLDQQVGLSKLNGGILYLTPPKNLSLLDRLFDAGVGQIAIDLDVWDEKLFEQLCPGKAKFTTRRQHLDALLYIAEKYGTNRACSVLVAGLESPETMIAGLTFLAEHGIVPLPSPLMPYGNGNPLLPPPPDVDYYRIIRAETAKLYVKHGLVVPGSAGSNVCMSRDIWLRREQLY
jgi:hypothetical protein